MHNKRKSVVDDRFIRILKTKIHKYMTSISKRVYIDKLKETDAKYNKSYYGTLKTILADVQLGTYFECRIEQNDKDPKFKVGHYVIISK